MLETHHLMKCANLSLVTSFPLFLPISFLYHHHQLHFHAVFEIWTLTQGIGTEGMLVFSCLPSTLCYINICRCPNIHKLDLESAESPALS